jgi:hypothetical protein
VSGAKIDDCADVVGMRRDPWREERRKDDDSHDGRADYCSRIAAEPMPVLIGY